MSYTPDFKPFVSGCGVCKPSTDYYKIQTGGDGLDHKGKNFYVDSKISIPVKSNCYYETANGGSKKKPSKKVKGGFFDMKKILNIGKAQTEYPTPEEETMSGGKKSKKTKKSVQSKSTSKKLVKRSKKMKGGMESSGATSMNLRFYNPDEKLDDYSELSGNGAMSAYGPIESGDVGTGMLAPYTLSNPSSGMKTGGSKKSKQKSENKKKDKKTIKSTSKKPVKKSKKMKGGMESSGATSMNSRFYNPDEKLNDYSELSGNGAMSAYGPIESGDVGTGMLAPYTLSNPSSGMKTGGAKKKKLNGGGGNLIPLVNPEPVENVRNTLDNVINNFVNFMSQLDANYNKSVQAISSVKFGNQKLIQQGGKKLKVSKKSPKKSKKLKVKKGGSNGSDFALTLNSRGPVNAPDNYWGVDGEQWFRQFNKTGDYIPNSKLAYAATPLLAGENDSGVVSGYDESTMAYPSV